MVLRAHSRKQNYVCIKQQSLWALTDISSPCIYSHISQFCIVFIVNFEQVSTD